MNKKVDYIEKYFKINNLRKKGNFNARKALNKNNNYINKSKDIVKISNKIPVKKTRQIPPYYIIFKISPGMRKVEVSYEVNTFRNNFANYIA